MYRIGGQVKLMKVIWALILCSGISASLFMPNNNKRSMSDKSKLDLARIFKENRRNNNGVIVDGRNAVDRVDDINDKKLNDKFDNVIDNVQELVRLLIASRKKQQRRKDEAKTRNTSKNSYKDLVKSLNDIIIASEQTT